VSENDFQYQVERAVRAGAPAIAPRRTLTRLQVLSRVAASLLGGYVFVWGFITLGVAAGVTLGMRYHDAEHLFYLLAFLVFVVCFCWAFVARRIAWVWTLLGGGGVLMTAAAWLLAKAQA
jgi:hypothetical protein